jgi:hypothetical protein
MGAPIPGGCGSEPDTVQGLENAAIALMLGAGLD